MPSQNPWSHSIRANLKNQEIEEGISTEADIIDAASVEARLNYLRARAISPQSWYDTICGECGRRCCSPCTAGGDPEHCAHTMFTYCDVCGHLSSAHYSASH
jgi:hypothetical protein